MRAPINPTKAIRSQSLRSLLRRGLITLAIETSCDDTSVAILEKHPNNAATLHFHSRVTSDNLIFKGIHPLAAHLSHQRNLADLVSKAITYLPRTSHGFDPPDFVSVTRGPGMRANLVTGIDTAKGLAVAWQRPLLGVNHMQAHALTPRLLSALKAQPSSPKPHPITPVFPFLTLLVSGGHTQLVHSIDVCDHRILANTTDLAIGAMLDKAARAILPEDLIAAAADVSYGRLLETFAFPNAKDAVEYARPSAHQHHCAFTHPYTNPGPGGKASRNHEFTYSGIGSQVQTFMKLNPGMDRDERRVLAKEMMRTAFEHLASRVLLALEHSAKHARCLVVSGGVASNRYLQFVMRDCLTRDGSGDVELIFPPAEFCTDNAAMIAAVGMGMWDLGWRSALDILPAKKWSIDPRGEDGGVLGLDGWVRR